LTDFNKIHDDDDDNVLRGDIDNITPN